MLKEKEMVRTYSPDISLKDAALFTASGTFLLRIGEILAKQNDTLGTIIFFIGFFELGYVYSGVFKPGSLNNIAINIRMIAAALRGEKKILDDDGELTGKMLGNLNDEISLADIKNVVIIDEVEGSKSLKSYK